MKIIDPGPKFPKNEGAAVVWSMDHNGETHIEFEPERALAHLLLHEVVFTNDHWWKKEWPEDAKETFSINVNCNDVFAWGAADAEELPHDQLETLWYMWRKDPDWGPAIWCIQKRRQMPQKPVEARIRRAGIWNLDEMALGPNVDDAQLKNAFAAIRDRLSQEQQDAASQS